MRNILKSVALLDDQDRSLLAGTTSTVVVSALSTAS